MTCALQAEVDSFLLSLPLGTGPEAAEVEARVAERLVETQAEVAAMQGRVAQWWVVDGWGRVGGGDGGCIRALCAACEMRLGVDQHMATPGVHADKGGVVWGGTSVERVERVGQTGKTHGVPRTSLAFWCNKFPLATALPCYRQVIVR